MKLSDMDAGLYLCEYIIFLTLLPGFLMVCRQELMKNCQEWILNPSSGQPTGTADRKGFMSANRQEKSTFPDNVVLSAHS